MDTTAGVAAMIRNRLNTTVYMTKDHDAVDFGIMLGLLKARSVLPGDLWAIERNIIIKYIASYTKQIL